MTLGGLIIIGNTQNKSEQTRVIGHPDLAAGTSVRHGATLYVSVAEAVYRESQGEDVELHLTPTPEDDEALAGFRARTRRRWEGDRLPDGWTRPLPPPRPKDTGTAERGDDGMNDELREIAERIRAKGSERPH